MHLPFQLSAEHLTGLHLVLMVGRFAWRMAQIAYQIMWEGVLNGRGRQDEGCQLDSLDLVGIVVHWGYMHQDAADTGYIHIGCWYPRIGIGWKSIG